MFKISIFTSLIFCAVISHATSLHPCTPTQKAAPTIISCHADNKFYSITINTWMSPASKMCQGNSHYEVKTASIKISSAENNSIATIEISNGNFTYELGLLNSKFNSDALFLNLDNCVSPQHGGFSIGN